MAKLIINLTPKYMEEYQETYAEQSRRIAAAQGPDEAERRAINAQMAKERAAFTDALTHRPQALQRFPQDGEGI